MQVKQSESESEEESDDDFGDEMPEIKEIIVAPVKVSNVNKRKIKKVIF